LLTLKWGSGGDCKGVSSSRRGLRNSRCGLGGGGGNEKTDSSGVPEVGRGGAPTPGVVFVCGQLGVKGGEGGGGVPLTSVLGADLFLHPKSGAVFEKVACSKQGENRS